MREERFTLTMLEFACLECGGGLGACRCRCECDDVCVCVCVCVCVSVMKDECQFDTRELRRWYTLSTPPQSMTFARDPRAKAIKLKGEHVQCFSAVQLSAPRSHQTPPDLDVQTCV